MHHKPAPTDVHNQPDTVRLNDTAYLMLSSRTTSHRIPTTCFAILPLIVFAIFATGTLQAQDKQQTAPARERYIPADELDAVFERSPAGVMLPQAQFRDLLEKAQLAQSKQNQNPAGVVMRSATYHVAPAEQHAVISLSIDIEQFADHWVTTYIPIGNLLVESAEINGATAAVGSDPEHSDKLTLAHRNPGRFTLELKLSTPLGVVGSDRVAAFKMVSCASTVSVVCPENRVLHVNEQKLERPDPIDQATEYSFPAGTNNSTTLKWTARQQNLETQTLVFAKSNVQVRLSSDNLRWNSDSRVSVFGNSINQLTARVPSSLEVTNIESTGLESWKLEDEPSNSSFTRVLLNYRQPFTEDRLLKISAVAALGEDGTTKLPTLEFIDVTSHTGRLFVNHEDQLRLLANVSGGVRQLGTEAQTANYPSGEVFNFWLQDFQLSVAIKPRDRELFAELNSRLSINDTTAAFVCEATIETLNAPLFELPVQLPPDWQIQQITDGNGAILKWRASDNADQIIVEPASPVSANGLFNFTTVFSRTIGDPTIQQTLPLPVLSALNTLLVGGTYQISSANDLTFAPIEFAGLSPLDDVDGTLLFETQGTQYSGQIAVVRKPVRLSSRSVIKSWMDARQISVDVMLTVDILNGTTRMLQLTMPESLGRELRFSVVSIGEVPGIPGQNIPDNVSIIEQTSGEAADKQRTFQLTFDKRFAGAITLRAFIQQSRNEASNLSAPFAKVAGAVRQHGLVAFEAYPEQQLDAAIADVAASGLTLADSGLVEAPAEKTGRRTALVYRFIHPDYRLEVSETRFETESVPSAVCENIANVSVLGDAGTIQRSCRAQFRCIGVQTLRFALPGADQSFLWSTVLNGEAIEVRRDGIDYLVAIPTSREQSEHVLEVLFETTNPETSAMGNSTQQSLQLAIDTDKGKASSIEILEQSWEIRYPSTSMLVDQTGGFHPVTDVEKPGLLQALTSLLRVPSRDAVLRQLIPVGIMLLCLFVLTALVVRRRWKSLICILLPGLLITPMLLLNATKSKFAMTPGSIDHFAESDKMEPMDGGVAASTRLGVDLSGGTNFSFSVAQSMAGGEMEETTRFNRTVPDAMFEHQIPSFDATDAASPVQVPSQGGYILNQPPTAMDRDRYNGGMGGGGMDASGKAMEEAKQQAQSGQSGSVFSDSPGSVPQAQQPPQNRRGGQIADFENTPPATGFFAGQLGQSDFEYGENQANGAIRMKRQSGSARLSVHAAVANPEDYRAMQFRSIGGTSAAGSLQVVVQERSRMNALRLIGAAIIVLLCLTLNSQSLMKKLCLAMTLFLATAAAVPLVPNQWQSLVDGVGMGTVCGICLWTTCWIVLSVQAIWKSCRANGATNLLKRSTSTAAITIITLTSFSVATTAVSARDDDHKSIRPDVVLPYAPGQPELLAERVFLSKEEFLKLYSQAYPDELRSSNAPTESRVVAAFYKSGQQLQVKDSNWSQTFTARYVIRSYSETPVSVSLPIGQVAVRSAKLNGGDAILVAERAVPVLLEDSPNQPAGQNKQQLQAPQQAPILPIKSDSSYSVHIPTKGVHLLDLVFDVAATIENSVGHISLPLRPVPAGTISFQIPNEQLDVQVNGRSNAFRKDGAILIIPIAAAGSTRIDWRPTTAQTSANTIYHALVNSALTLDDAGMTVHASIGINCRQGQLSEIEISVPKEYSVQAVSGNEIAGWNIADDKQESVKLQFKQAIEGETRFNLILFRKLVLTSESTSLDVPVLSVTGASRDSGNVTVLGGRELEVRVDSLSGVTQLNAAESTLPQGIDTTLRRVHAWRYTRHPVAISIRVFRTVDRMQITMLNGVQLEAQRQLWTTLINADISGAPRRRLEIRVPNDFLALDVSANDLADWYYTQPDDDKATFKILNIQFHTARQGIVSAVIQAQSDLSDKLNETKLVTPIVLAADEAITNLSVWLDAASKISTAAAEGWKRAGGETAIDPRILQLQSDAPDISFTTTDSAPQPVVLGLMQATPGLIPESVSVTNVTDTSIELTLALKWQIAGAATRELSFTLPEVRGDSYDFRIPGLRQLEKKTTDGRVHFTVHLQQPVSEHFFILATATLPLTDSKQIAAQPPEFPGYEAKASHFWVIVNQSAGLLQAVDMATDGEDVSPTDIKIKLPEGLLQQSVAIRRLKADRPNSPWQLNFAERQKVAPAVIALASHTTIIAADSTWRSFHKLQMRNESRQFLPVILPDSSRVLFCRVEGQPTRIVSRNLDDKTLHLVPIPQSGRACTPFNVEFALAGTLPVLSETLSAETLSIPVPEFPEFRDFPDYGITVSRNTWSVHVPEQWRASLINDPRKTNVIEASEDDFEDAILLSTVDNLKSMVNSMNFGSANRFGNDQSWFQQIQEQQKTLESLSGNSQIVEDLRQNVLQEYESIVQQKLDVVGGGGGGGGGGGIFENASPTNQLDGRNRWLEEQEDVQNGFNNSNAIRLFEDNAGLGVQLNSRQDTDKKFRFALPELIAKESFLREQSLPMSKALSDKAKDQKAENKGLSKPDFRNRSQLLERRKSNLKQQSDRGQGLDLLSELAAKSIAEPQTPFAPTQTAAPPVRDELHHRELTAQLGWADNAYPWEDTAGEATGLLSLSFQIPQDGVRHGFVRTGGNAMLTLGIRSSEVIETRLGLIWAGLCAIMAVLLLRNSATGSSAVLLQLLLLAAFLGITGWIFLPNPLHGFSLLTCLVASLGVCGTLIWRSFRRPLAA